MKHIEIYTDGACSGNPGPGGWAAVLKFKQTEKEISGCEPMTTNNRMELTAVIKALAALKEPCDVSLYTDSSYVANAFNEGWLKNWIARDWRTAARKPVENRDLWEQLISLSGLHHVCFIKVKGHSDNAYNNRCDALARAAIRALSEMQTTETGESTDT